MNDPDAGLTPRERTRQALHRAVDHVLRAWPHAQADIDARGFTARGTGNNSGELTSVEAAATTTSRATAWLAELRAVQILLFTGIYYTVAPDGTPNDIRQSGFYTVNHDTFRLFGHAYADRLVDRWPPWAEPCCRRLIVLANQAQQWWPPPPARGHTIAGVTVGMRGNSVENCVLCGDPAPSGRDPETGQPLVRRMDGEPFHANTCYYQVWRQRHRTA